MKRSEILKIRYQVYRDLGYSSKEAQKLRYRSLDVSGIKIDKSGKVEKKNNYKNLVKNKNVDDFTQKVRNVKNDTLLQKWGMLTKDERYKHETIEKVNYIKKDLKLTNDQAYYFTYIMVTNGLSYKEAKEQLLSSKEFEMYKSKGRAEYKARAKVGKKKR